MTFSEIQQLRVVFRITARAGRITWWIMDSLVEGLGEGWEEWVRMWVVVSVCGLSVVWMLIEEMDGLIVVLRMVVWTRWFACDIELTCLLGS